MEQTTKLNLKAIFLFMFFLKTLGMITYDVVELGADPNGHDNSTFAFQKAWSKACSSHEKASIYVPQGSYLLYKINFNGPCNNREISIEIDGSLIAPSDYHELGNAKTWIRFEKVYGLSIVGGVLDGKGSNLWDCKASGNDCPRGATTLALINSDNINIGGLTSEASQLFHIVIEGCKDVQLDGVRVIAPKESPNTDGIHVQSSMNVAIRDAQIGTGDDCISIGPGTKDLWIENVSCGPGHGISIGSLGKTSDEEGVENVTVKSVSFCDAKNGLRIKTWGRPCNSFVKGVLFENASMDFVKYPIIVDQNYCPGKKDCPGQESGVKISKVKYVNIYGTTATEVAVKFDCSKTNPCRKIRLEEINLAYKGDQPAEAWCGSAFGSSSGTVNPKSCLEWDIESISKAEGLDFHSRKVSHKRELL